MRDLALQSFVSVTAIKIIECGQNLTDESRRQLEAIETTLEAVGIHFEGDSTASKRLR